MWVFETVVKRKRKECLDREEEGGSDDEQWYKFFFIKISYISYDILIMVS